MLVTNPTLNKGDNQVVQYAVSKAMAQMTTNLALYHSPIAEGLISYIAKAGTASGDKDGEEFTKALDKHLDPINKIAKIYRQTGWKKYLGQQAPEIAAADLIKAELDVGTLTNFSQITGGQTLGYVSLDTRLARGTVRPSSFTLYQHLNKSAAKQVVDYWAYADATGGSPPGAAFQGYSNVGTGTLSTNAGSYSLQNITLKLAVDGRAITTALAAQNSFVNVAEQETTNAALSILESLNWACYFGNPTLYPNQFQGLLQSIPSKNIYSFEQFYTQGPAVQEGWSKALTLFNLIYEVAASVTSYNTYGHITHAFMSPTAMGSMEGLTQQQLNNILNEFSAQQGRNPIWDNGNLMGMRTRFGDIQFPLDLFINARNAPLMSILNSAGQSQATSVSPTPPATVTAAATAAVPGSLFTTTFAPTSGANYFYAVASMDSNMNESTLTYTAVVTGVTAGGGVTLTIAPPSDHTAAVFRIYRSSLNATSAQASGTPVGNGVRFIAEVAANGASNVVFTDINSQIPGSEFIFLLDLDDNDFALDYRYLLPISKIELFASNLYMPWAVAAIGAIRTTIPKFHAVISNYIPDNPVWDPLNPSVNPND